MNKKIIGLCIAYKKNHNNYGTSLQGFATVKMVSNLGYQCEILCYKKKRNLRQYMLYAPLIMISGGWITFKRRIAFKNNIKKVLSYAAGIAERTKVVNQYKDTYFEPLCRTYTGYHALSEGSRNYSLVLVGSDQVWLPLGLYSKFFNLLFVADSIPKVSYASSFGVSKIPFWQIKQTKTYLERFDAISTREIRGKQIIESISNRTAMVVLDPTLLLTKEQWGKEADCATWRLNEEYILCYLLGDNKDSRDAANELSQVTGLKIVFMPHMDEYISSDDTFGDIRPYGISPVDFINLVRNATYVCTDSFHGTVFSIIFEKQFATFYRFNSNSPNSRNSRIDSLFELLGLQTRLSEGDAATMIKKPINYTDVSDKLKILRQESLQYLEESLRLSGRD